MIGLEPSSRAELTAHQATALQALARLCWEQSPFYRRKWEAAGITGPDAISGPADLTRLPFTTRAELVAAQTAHPPAGDLLTVPLSECVSVHQSAGRHGPPLLWYDSAPDRTWVEQTWDYIFAAAGLTPADRAYFAVPFGPVLLYWSGFEQSKARGMLTFTGGAMSALQQVENLYELGVSVLVTEHDHVLKLAEVAQGHGFHPARSSLRAVIYAGRPGLDPRAAADAVRSAWGAEAFSVTWLTEGGITGYECEAHSGGVHLLESEHICEIIDPVSGQPVAPGHSGELVITALGRTAMPVVRYRTGDRVRLATEPCSCGRNFTLLTGPLVAGAQGGAA